MGGATGPDRAVAPALGALLALVAGVGRTSLAMARNRVIVLAVRSIDRPRR